MVDTPNDIATHVEAESTTKVDAINLAFDAFDISVNDDVSIASADSLVTVTAAQYLDNGLIVLTTGATGAIS